MGFPAALFSWEARGGGKLEGEQRDGQGKRPLLEGTARGGSLRSRAEVWRKLSADPETEPRLEPA